MLTGLKVFSQAEIRSRYEITLENYCKAVNIEGRTMVDMVKKQIAPAVEKYTGDLAAAAASKKAAVPGLALTHETNLITTLSGLTDEMDKALAGLEDALSAYAAESDITKASCLIRDRVLPAMDALRAPCDKAETLTAESYWPFPNYGDLLFGVR